MDYCRTFPMHLLSGSMVGCYPRSFSGELSSRVFPALVRYSGDTDLFTTCDDNGAIINRCFTMPYPKLDPYRRCIASKIRVGHGFYAKISLEAYFVPKGNG